jgi:hypothetical protein
VRRIGWPKPKLILAKHGCCPGTHLMPFSRLRNSAALSSVPAARAKFAATSAIPSPSWHCPMTAGQVLSGTDKQKYDEASFSGHHLLGRRCPSLSLCQSTATGNMTLHAGLGLPKPLWKVWSGGALLLRGPGKVLPVPAELFYLPCGTRHGPWDLGRITMSGP